MQCPTQSVRKGGEILDINMKNGAGQSLTGHVSPRVKQLQQNFLVNKREDDKLSLLLT